VKHVIKNPNFPKVVWQHISGALVDLIPSLSALHCISECDSERIINTGPHWRELWNTFIQFNSTILRARFLLRHSVDIYYVMHPWSWYDSSTLLDGRSTCCLHDILFPAPRICVNLIAVTIGIARGRAWGPRPPKGVEKLALPFWRCKMDKYIRESIMFSNCECECDSICAAEMSNMFFKL